MSSEDSLTVQGDISAGRAGQSVDISSFTQPFLQTVRGDADLSGGNVLSRWRHMFSASSDMSLQFYYDRTNRTQPNFREFRDTLDLDFQHHFRLSSRHDFMWGLGYRLTSGLTRGIPTVMFQPTQRSDNLYSAFGQYELSVIPDHIRMIVGLKIQHNDYSGFEFQPNGRIVWTPNARHTVWAAISRAVRTPSRVEHDLTIYQNAIPGLPAFAKVLPDKNFASEKVIAYELGYRMQATDRLFLDIAGFYNSYTDLLSAEIVGPASVELTPSPPHFILPLMFANRLHGEVLGMELTSTWQILTWWRLRGSYSFLKLNLTANADSTDTVNAAKTEESSPNHQVSFQSTMDLPGKIEFDLTPRFVSELSGQGVPSYYAIDARFGWHPTSNMEIAFIGRNLTGQHPEFNGDNNGLTNIQRGLYAKATWRW